jgi:hypothetical protein
MQAGDNGPGQRRDFARVQQSQRCPKRHRKGRPPSSATIMHFPGAIRNQFIGEKPAVRLTARIFRGH